MRRDRWIVHLATLLLLALTLLILLIRPVRAADGVSGIASHYGPGGGVATQWCTWTKRHSSGCGWLRIRSAQTGLTVVVPVIDWCQCYRHSADARIVDMQWDVVAALGLDLADGLYRVTIWREAGGGAQGGLLTPPLPDTAMRP